MNKEFIPYEQALELRKLGFDEECLAYWTSGINGYYIEYKHYTNKHWMFTANDNKGRDKMCTAPLYQQAFRWFRKAHNLEGEVHCIRFNSERLKGYQYSITSENYRKFEQRGDYHTYEEAELACLKKLIEIAKQQ